MHGGTKKIRKFHNRSYKCTLVGYLSDTIYKLLNPQGKVIRSSSVVFNELGVDPELSSESKDDSVQEQPPPKQQRTTGPGGSLPRSLLLISEDAPIILRRQAAPTSAPARLFSIVILLRGRDVPITEINTRSEAPSPESRITEVSDSESDLEPKHTNQSLVKVLQDYPELRIPERSFSESLLYAFVAVA